MRLSDRELFSDYCIAVLDDEQGVVDAIIVALQGKGYRLKGFTDPNEAIEEIKTGNYDLLILDYLMSYMHGDEVVRNIRKFNDELYILLLTGHKDLAPPFETLTSLDIQAYCEKSSKLDQFKLMIASGIKAVAQNRDIRKYHKKLRESYIDSIELIRQAVDARDTYTRGHSERVAYFAVKIGEALGLDDKDIELLNLGGIFHDIGKIAITDNILFKVGRLTTYEYEEIKKHPNKGAMMLSAVSMFREVLPIVKHHHERYDGNGYPDGLKGKDIPYLARILSIVDAFDAMTSERAYRNKLTMDQAKKQLVQCSGTQFDSELAEVFLNLLESYDEMVKDLNVS